MNNLTILLSSHLLSEVEQLCTRIAVMNQGRKVFEGSLAEVRAARGWVRLETGDFAAATQLLRAGGLILSEREGRYIQLTPEASPDRVVRALVAAGMPVHEIARHEETLEDFYLDLMNRNRLAAGPQGVES